MNEIQKIEKEIYSLTKKLEVLRKEHKPTEIKNYAFADQNGNTNLLNLFAGKDTLFAVHNMGQGCRYCTVWGDGINSFLPHLESQFSVVLLSKDSPETQRQFANSRGWRFRLASHGGGEYIKDQTVSPGEGNMPGIVCYQKVGDKIFRKNSSPFGPGDLFCSFWHIISLAGVSTEEFTPQFNYWSRPAMMDDGGQNLK